MATSLGPGVRVYVGWRPSSEVSSDLGFDPRFRVGTVREGPFEPGQFALASDGSVEYLEDAFWNVELDGGDRIAAS